MVFGLFGASILGLTIVPLATALCFSEMFGYEGSLDADFKKVDFFIVFYFQIFIGLIIALIPSINLFDLTLYVDYLNGAMLPIIFYFLVKFYEDEEVMGQYASRGLTSILVKASAIIITLAVIITTIGKIMGVE